jgi:hypothetical protein
MFIANIPYVTRNIISAATGLCHHGAKASGVAAQAGRKHPATISAYLLGIRRDRTSEIQLRMVTAKTTAIIAKVTNDIRDPH